MRPYKVKPCTGNKLEELLNDMVEEGYDVFQVDFNGNKIVENRIAPGQKTALPMYTCIFKKRGLVDA